MLGAPANCSWFTNFLNWCFISVGRALLLYKIFLLLVGRKWTSRFKTCQRAPSLQRTVYKIGRLVICDSRFFTCDNSKILNFFARFSITRKIDRALSLISKSTILFLGHLNERLHLKLLLLGLSFFALLILVLLITVMSCTVNLRTRIGQTCLWSVNVATTNGPSKGHICIPMTSMATLLLWVRRSLRLLRLINLILLFLKAHFLKLLQILVKALGTLNHQKLMDTNLLVWVVLSFRRTQNLVQLWGSTLHWVTLDLGPNFVLLIYMVIVFWRKLVLHFLIVVFGSRREVKFGIIYVRLLVGELLLFSWRLNRRKHLFLRIWRKLTILGRKNVMGRIFLIG